MIRHAAITDTAIDCAAWQRAIEVDQAGAVVTFTGTVRNHDQGRAVVGIDYLAHPDAEPILAGIVDDLTADAEVYGVVAIHRVGHLDIGDVAVFLAVSSAHRAEAFALTRELIETIKQRLPIWKKQLLPDGSHEWSQCP